MFSFPLNGWHETDTDGQRWTDGGNAQCGLRPIGEGRMLTFEIEDRNKLCLCIVTQIISQRENSYSRSSHSSSACNCEKLGNCVVTCDDGWSKRTGPVG